MTDSTRVPLSDEWTQYMARLRESGMGYHRVDVIFGDRTEAKGCIVFNSEEIELPGESASKEIVELALSEKLGLEERLDHALGILEDAQTAKGSTQSANEPAYGAFRGGYGVKKEKRQKPSKPKHPSEEE